MSLATGDVVRLEVDNGQLGRSEYNSLVMYLVEDNKPGHCGETCSCHCNNDCCSDSSQTERTPGGFYQAPGGSGYRTEETSDTTPVIYITTPRSYYPTQPPLTSPPPPPPPHPSRGSYSTPASRCCRLVSVSLDSVSARHQDSKAGLYRLLEDTGPGQTVYRQERGENFIFYFNHPAWKGWIVGPQVGLEILVEFRSSRY